MPEVPGEHIKKNPSIAGAQFLETKLLRQGGLVGLGWGYTVSGITRHLSHLVRQGTSFVSLCGGGDPIPQRTKIGKYRSTLIRVSLSVSRAPGALASEFPAAA